MNVVAIINERLPILLARVVCRSTINPEVLSAVAVRYEIEFAHIEIRRVLMPFATCGENLPFARRRVRCQIAILVHRFRTRADKKHLAVARPSDIRVKEHVLFVEDLRRLVAAKHVSPDEVRSLRNIVLRAEEHGLIVRRPNERRYAFELLREHLTRPEVLE